MINKKVDEAIFDVLLENAFSDVIEEDVAKLEKESDSCTISAETELKIKKMIAHAGKTEKQKTMRVVIRVASITLVVLLNLGLFGILMVPSVNAEVKNVFADLFEKYISYETKEQKSLVASTSEYGLFYIPDEFELILNDDYQILFREENQGNGYISINISDENFGRMSLDSENEITNNVKIHEIDAYLIYENGDYTLFWYDGYHFISILSNIEEDKVIKIANNIEKLDDV
ncbi:MAG: DUF4367 domain-containing protein [Clostridia bacterium]|nr:DUF4367 domain-containing protein [Clostridia bacterium]